jgi:NAD(P)-dependent dehydrogenase (short-subunit alcohol dehydrogenase family)/AcrR family transcriptional regulator
MARYGTQHKEATRRRIVEAAGRRLKRDGIDGTGIAALMADAGLTNGAFYAHFASKDDLVASVVAEELRLQASGFGALDAGPAGVEQLVRAYLSPEHRDHPEAGCPSAALLDEIGRSDDLTRQAYTAGARTIIDEIASHLAPDDPGTAHGLAINVLSLIVGTLQLSRAMTDHELSIEVLEKGLECVVSLINQGNNRCSSLQGDRMTQLTAQTALVTGANRGLGREFVNQLLERGVSKVYAAARDPKAITATDPRVVPLQLDVTDRDSVARAAEVADDVSVVVNNAGILAGAPVLDHDTSQLRRELEVNLFGPLAVTSAFAESVAERSGVVVNVASVLSWLALGGSYSISKAALWSATDSMRLELAPRGVQVVGVHMGYVDTDMTVGVDAPKTAPADVVRQVLDGIEAGALEVMADDMTREVRGGLQHPVGARYAGFMPSPA